MSYIYQRREADFQPVLAQMSRLHEQHAMHGRQASASHPGTHAGDHTAHMQRPPGQPYAQQATGVASENLRSGHQGIYKIVTAAATTEEPGQTQPGPESQQHQRSQTQIASASTVSKAILDHQYRLAFNTALKLNRARSPISQTTIPRSIIYLVRGHWWRL
jgi:hypothetical protein